MCLIIRIKVKHSLIIHSLEAIVFFIFLQFPDWLSFLWYCFANCDILVLQKIAQHLNQTAQMNETLIECHKALAAKVVN